MFLVDNERGEDINIGIGKKKFAVGESEANGHFETMLKISVADMKKLTVGKNPNRVTFVAVTDAGDKRTFVGSFELVVPTGVSIISDIDDTIKVSNVLDKKALIRNTFLEEFKPVGGMSALYKQWGKSGAVFHYVSAAPWQLYEPIVGFMDAQNFPGGSLHMRQLRWKDSSVLDFLSSSADYKVETITGILKRFPKRKFVLVGDSGERDPEVYGQIARAHPDQIERILIRKVPEDTTKADRFEKAFEDVPKAKWQVFDLPVEVLKPM